MPGKPAALLIDSGKALQSQAGWTDGVMGAETPVDVRIVEDMAVVRLHCGSAPSEEIISSLRSKIAEARVGKIVLVVNEIRKVDAPISSFLAAVDDVFKDVKNPVVVFDSSGMFQSLTGTGGPYLFSKNESEALDRVSEEFIREEGAARGEKTRVLIIEDDKDVMEFLVDLLGTENRFEVRTATSGFEGGLATACFKPHLILLDIMLPDIDGRDVCRILRSNQHVGNPKIIALTALSREKDVSEIVSVGVDDYLGKPFRISVLLKKIDRLLAREG